MDDLPKVIRDPVHNLIELPNDDEGRMILDLIDRPEFQRLRRIRQLGFGFLTYPGAEHSRWGHSVGVFHVARRMLEALRKQHGVDSEEYRELARLRRPIVAAALLHDVGHGPFSHVLERTVAMKNAPDGSPRNHEQWASRIIRERLSPVLSGHGVHAEAVAGLIDKKNRSDLLAKDFISSQLDADRMDYLLRDSRSAGPRYGEFDLEWLLHSLRIGKVSAKGQTGTVWRLCFDSRKAVHVVEEYIQAREFMYAQVYVHKATRAYEALFANIVALAAAIANGDPTRVPTPCPDAFNKMLVGRPIDTAEYLTLDDARLWCTLLDWCSHASSSDTKLARLGTMCRRLVNREQPYGMITLDNQDKRTRAIRLETRLEKTDHRFACVVDTFVDLAYRNALYRQSKEDEEQEDRVIYLVDALGRTHPAESESDVIRAISTIPTTIDRLYYDETDKELVQQLKSEGWLPTEEQQRGGWVGHEGL